MSISDVRSSVSRFGWQFDLADKLLKVVLHDQAGIKYTLQSSQIWKI